jgi:hypothetical protein
MITNHHISSRDSSFEEVAQAYRMSVSRLARDKWLQEQRIEKTLEVLQRLESKKLGIVNTGKSKSHCIFPAIVHQPRSFTSSSSEALSNLPKFLEPSIERPAVFIASYQPQSDLTALLRTIPYRTVLARSTGLQISRSRR